MLEIIRSFRWQDGLEIILFSFLIYRFFIFIKGRRTQGVFYGLILLIVMGFAAELLKFYTISWVFKNLFAIWVIALLIVFQPELRNGLARLGTNPFFIPPQEEKIIDEIVKSANYLSRNHMGAIIVLEREMGLRDYMEGGVMIDAEASSELITTIFTPLTPLHDGAVIIEKGRLVAANCIFPLPEEIGKMKGMGARHRAAFNLARETDALVVVVSEETGKISLAYQGKMEKGLDGIILREKLKKTLKISHPHRVLKKSEK